MSENESFKAYSLVDYSAHYQKGFRNNVIPVWQVPEAVERYHRFECYSTFFLYSEEIRSYMQKNIRNGHPSISGYPGSVWGYYIPIDIDVRTENSTEGLETARELSGFLTGYLNLDRESLLAYFSGSGFHLMIASQKFEARPSADLHVVYAGIRSELMRLSKIKNPEGVDLTICDKTRLWRLPGTLNKKTGLYKTQLELDELSSLTVDEIVELSRRPRPVRYTDPTGLIPSSETLPNPRAKNLYESVAREVMEKPKRYYPVPASLREAADPLSTLCKARRKIWDSTVPEGQRNHSGIRLASWFRICGASEDETRRLLQHWDDKNSIGLPLDELDRIVSSAFSATEPYRYFCFDEIIREHCPYYPARHTVCSQFRIFKGYQKEEKL